VAIGVFDSGVGGLTVLKELIKRLPGEDFIYFADTAFLPYGEKSAFQIYQRTTEVLSWMQKQNVKMAVNACHTSSSLGPYQSDCPLVTMSLPTAESVFSHSFQKGLGILATTLTVTQGALMGQLRSLGLAVKIYPQACPDLVFYIEEDNRDILLKEMHKYLDFFTQHPVDYILYGCTHYPLAHFYGHRFIDPAPFVALHAEEKLKEMNLLSQGQKGTIKVFFSGPGERVAYYLTKLSIECELMDDLSQKLVARAL
jgi:glutamate racemase